MLKNRHKIKAKYSVKIVNSIKQTLGCSIVGNLEIGTFKNQKIFFIGGKLFGLFINDQPFLNVEGLKAFKANKRHVTVDDGAIKFILNGADIMFPGITHADGDIYEGDLVWIKDGRGLPISIGKALVDGAKMTTIKKGKAIENLHYIGDELWEFSRLY